MLLATIDLPNATSDFHRLTATTDAVYVNAAPAIRIDPATNEATEITGGTPAISITSDGTRLWTAGFDGTIQRVDPDGTITTLDLAVPRSMDLAWHNGIVWGISQVSGASDLIAFDADTGTLLHEVPVARDINGFPVRLVVDDHDVVVGVDTSGGGGRSGEVILVDPSTATITSTIPLGSRPEGIVVTPNYIWTSGAVIDRATVEVTDMNFGFTITRGPDGSIWGIGTTGLASNLHRYAPGDRKG